MYGVNDIIVASNDNIMIKNNWYLLMTSIFIQFQLKSLLAVTICKINVVASSISFATIRMVTHPLKVYFMKGLERH